MEARMITAEMIGNYVAEKLKPILPIKNYGKDKLVLESVVLSNQVTLKNFEMDFEWFCQEFIDPALNSKWEQKVLPLKDSFRNLLFSLPEPGGCEYYNIIDTAGWSIRVVRGYDIHDNSILTRIDLLYGITLEQKYSIEGGQ
jgi:hypothetical protein